jgi:ketosteroid isomerase-like protein
MKNVIKSAALSFAAVALVGAAMASSEPARAANVSQAEQNRTIIARGLQAWADGTGSPYDLLAPNVSWTIAGNSKGSRNYPSKEAFMSEVIRPFNARMRDRLIPSVHRIYADGDAVVAHFDARGVALDGKPYVNSYAWILRMQAGQVVEAQAFFDAHAFDDLWTRVQPASAP